jgi:hypothetical protein
MGIIMEQIFAYLLLFNPKDSPLQISTIHIGLITAEGDE